MLQHLWTGPISNASVDVVQGSHSVVVRAVGVTKVSACHFKATFKYFLLPANQNKDLFSTTMGITVHAYLTNT